MLSIFCSNYTVQYVHVDEKKKGGGAYSALDSEFTCSPVHGLNVDRKFCCTSSRPVREILSSDGVIQMFPQPFSSPTVKVLSEKEPGLIKRHLTNRVNPCANPLIVLSAHNPESARLYVCHCPCWRTYFEDLMHECVPPE